MRRFFKEHGSLIVAILIVGFVIGASFIEAARSPEGIWRSTHMPAALPTVDPYDGSQDATPVAQFVIRAFPFTQEGDECGALITTTTHEATAGEGIGFVVVPIGADRQPIGEPIVSQSISSAINATFVIQSYEDCFKITSRPAPAEGGMPEVLPVPEDGFIF